MMAFYCVISNFEKKKSFYCKQNFFSPEVFTVKSFFTKE